MTVPVHPPVVEPRKTGYIITMELVHTAPTPEQREAAQRFWDSLILPLARQLEGEDEQN